MKVRVRDETNMTTLTIIDDIMHLPQCFDLTGPTCSIRFSLYFR